LLVFMLSYMDIIEGHQKQKSLVSIDFAFYQNNWSVYNKSFSF